VIAACAIHIPLARIPAHVIVIPHGHRAARPFLQAGDEIRVSRPGHITFAVAGNRYRITHGIVSLECRRELVGSTTSAPRTAVLAVELRSGRLSVRASRHVRRALVLSREMLAFATARATHFVVDRNPLARRTRAWTSDLPISTAKASDETVRITTRARYTAISDAKGLRLDVWPFSISRLQRPTTRADRLTPFWADGQPCSIGCGAPGVRGWPIKPFHQPHAIRAGINELRPANLHVAVDIEAADFQPVYAIQSGYASSSPTGSYRDYKVRVGAFTYWHIVPTVSTGQYVVAYKTRIGAVEQGFGHLAFEEGGDNDYLNPLRPGGPLRPYTDAEAPIIGTPHVFRDGRVIVGVFDPQSIIHRESYETPVLAPSALAWRLYDGRGRRAHRAASARQPAPRSLPPDRVCLGLGREHVGARRHHQASSRKGGRLRRTTPRIRSAQSEVRAVARLSC
jgi:hypothetical protein